MLKDGKSYTYLCIKKERFPRVFFTRKVVRDGSQYFGPYTSKFRTKQIFELVKNLFPIRTCKLNLTQSNIEKRKFKVCLEYHIGNCLGPCVGLQNEDDYNRSIDQVKNILNGKFKPVKDYIKEEMARLAEELKFEQAAQMKEKLSLFSEYQAKSTVVSQTINDVDVFSIDSNDEWAYINYMKVINGAVINTDTIEVKMNLDTDHRKILSYVIPEIRKKYNSISSELLLSEQIILAEKELNITVPQRGDKRKLLELSQKNVKYFLLQKKKESLAHVRKQTPAERILKTLQADLSMDDIPYHIECFDNSNIRIQKCQAVQA